MATILVLIKILKKIEKSVKKYKIYALNGI